MYRIKKLVALCVAIMAISPMTAAVAHDDHDDAYEPLGTRAMREDLKAEGYRNGRLPDDILREVPAGANERCYLERDAAVAWELLLIAAEAEGITGFAAGWCYRSLAAQRRTYDRNCGWVTPPAPPVEEGEEPPPPPPARFVCKVPTAKPGTSNHGWGRAIDVVDTTTRKSHVLSCRDPQFQWLLEHGPAFGWVLPSWARCGSSKQEPWHWEWAGVNAGTSALIIELRGARGLAQPR